MFITTKILVQEHRVIEAVLSCLEKLIEQTEQQHRLHKSSAQDILQFLREFADACHHGKEEDVLFVFSDSITSGHGPVEILKDEHREGRGYVTGMERNCEKASAGDKESLNTFCECGRDLIGMLRQHIYREDEAVFPMIDNLCSTQDADNLWQQFLAVEKKAGGDRHRRLIGIARKLCQVHGIPFPESRIPDLLERFA